MIGKIEAPAVQLGLIVPEMVVVGGIVVLLLLDTFSHQRSNRQSFGVATLTFFGALVAAAAGFGVNATGFSGMIVADPLRSVMSVAVLLSGGLAGLLAYRHVEATQQRASEFYVLLLSGTLGMLLMIGSANLIMLFLSLELMSIPVYALCGYDRKDQRSGESALKYLILGSVASAILLYGIALTYGVTGTMQIDQAMQPPGDNALAVVAYVFLWVGLLFKISLIPFHMWVPDVYEGAPTPVTAYMSTGVKVALFATVFRLFLAPDASDPTPWLPMLKFLAYVTMVGGNLMSLAQDRIKRMLAFSSIAHAGYMVAGLVAVSAAAVRGIEFYLYAYILMNVGAFASLMALGRDGKEVQTYNDLNGMAYKRPLLSLAFVVFLLSLGGIPPTVGFIGKLYLFDAMVEANELGLAIVGVLASAIGLFVYLKPIVHMYMHAAPEGEDEGPVGFSTTGPSRVLVTTIGLLVVSVIGLGLRPNSIISVAVRAAEDLMMR